MLLVHFVALFAKAAFFKENTCTGRQVIIETFLIPKNLTTP
jgi:hypothetical protein